MNQRKQIFNNKCIYNQQSESLQLFSLKASVT